jgi:hypothetical protein
MMRSHCCRRPVPLSSLEQSPIVLPWYLRLHLHPHSLPSPDKIDFEGILLFWSDREHTVMSIHFSIYRQIHIHSFCTCSFLFSLLIPTPFIPAVLFNRWAMLVSWLRKVSPDRLLVKASDKESSSAMEIKASVRWMHSRGAVVVSLFLFFIYLVALSWLFGRGQRHIDRWSARNGLLRRLSLGRLPFKVINSD